MSNMSCTSGGSSNRSVSSAEVERLRSTNTRLENTVQELKLEIAYYKGETKRLEWEKNILNQDVQRMSSLFKTWINELHQSQSSKSSSEQRHHHGSSNTSTSVKDRSIFENSTRIFGKDLQQMNAMIRYPCKPIVDLLQVNNEQIVFATSSQPPYYIEYVNKKWCDECGWQPSEVLGLTCSFLQGELTDVATTQNFMKDIKEVGYGNMRVYNYRKNGDVFEVNVTVYPVFDTICSVGPDAEIAVLTHFASVMTDIKPVSASRRHDHQSIGEAKSNHDHAMKVTMPTFSDGDTSHSSSTSMLNESGRGDEEDTSSSKKSVDKYDRRQQAKKHAPKFVLSPENFFQFGETIRLSNLMRLMLSCCSAMLLADRHGDVVHCNAEFSKLSGYEITDVQGMKFYDVMSGKGTKAESVDVMKKLLQDKKSIELQLIQHRKNDEALLNRVIVVPIYGGYMRAEITHYCLLYVMVQNLDNPVDSKEYHSTSPDVKIIEVQQVCSPINSHYASESNSSVSSMDNNSNVASNESNGNSGSSNNSDQSSNDDESSDYPRKRMRMDCSE